MFWDRLFGKKQNLVEVVHVGGNKEFSKHKNPLPDLFPEICQEKVKDDFAMLDAFLDENETAVADFIYACHHRREGIVERFMNNFRAIMELPLVYNYFASLKKDIRQRELENAFAVGSLLQLCLLYGDSDLLERLREDLMLILLGIFLRRYGIMFLSHEERDILGRTHQWDLTQERQKALRDQFLKQYRTVADKTARLSAERVLQGLGSVTSCPKEKLKAFLHVVRFSWRIKGRTAAILTESERDSVHNVAGYCSMVNAIASAWVAQRKRLTLILAEEWSRMRAASMSKQLTVGGSGTAVALQALSDLFDVTRCQVLTNFQASGRDAVYCPLTNVLAREQEVTAELKDGSDKSIRRYVRGAKSEETPAAEPDEVRTITQIQWKLFRLPEKINLPHRHLMKTLHEKRGTSDDPTFDELIPLDEDA